MDQMDDEIMVMFVEDSREHLGDIESALMDMERGGADIDEELVNTVFRAAHSIKGGAGFLNLNNIRDLAHKLEGLLHMVRSREIVPDTKLINGLLAGFDRLLGLVEAAAASDGEDIAAILDMLSGLTAEHLSPQQQEQAAATVPIALPGGEAIFTEDALSLSQALAGGKNLYLVEYDLIHDVQARGKTPLDIISTMESSGLIVDCRMDLASIGDIDAPPSNRIPFYILFATIVEPDIVSYLFALNSDFIHAVDVDAMAEAPAGTPAAQDAGSGDAPGDAAAVTEETEETIGPWRLCLRDGGGVVTLEDGAPALAAEARQALLTCLDRGVSVEMVWPKTCSLDLPLLQVLVSAGMSFAHRGLAFVHRGGTPEALSQLATRAGITPASLESVGLPASVLFPAG